jgi:hydrogenase maturation protease
LKEKPKILVYGYGNPGREDDGLGIAFTNNLESWAEVNRIDNISFDSNYQLNIEDAEKISLYDVVIFADASTEEIEDFCISLVDGANNVSFTTHAASPGYVVYLCKDLFNKSPLVYLLHLRGYQWEFKEGLSAKASENLSRALDYFIPLLASPEILENIESLDKKLCLKQ